MAGLATRQSGYKTASFLQHHAAFWEQGDGRLSGESVPYFFIPFVSLMTLGHFRYSRPPREVLWKCICLESGWPVLFPASDRGRGHFPGGNELECLLPS